MNRDAIVRAVEAAAQEMVDFARELVRIPTVNPPGEGYAECATMLAGKLRSLGFDVELLPAEGRPEHTTAYPRVNVLGTRRGEGRHPAIHLNGHVDVVPPGRGWTVDPFGGVVRDGKLYGRGSADMKGGLAAAVFAAEALRRAGHRLRGSIDISGIGRLTNLVEQRG